MPKTKIICTIGPASSSRKTLRKMMIAGMDVARLNFSHGKPEALRRIIETVRGLNSRYRRHIKFLGDLQGHRIRIGAIEGGSVELKRHKTLWITRKALAGSAHRISFDYRGNLSGIKNGCLIYIDDGNIALEVTGRAPGALKTKVVVPGTLKGHKGVNIPGARLEFGRLSAKDKEDIDFCVRHKVEYVAQSFVRTKGDVFEVKRRIPEGSGIKVIAKIENRDGINNIDEIIKAADGIMIARGDMGVSVPIYEIPVIQKMIIKRCNKAGKPVITATQMLESMTENRRPTRAEVTDVANAIIDGTDFVMLSAESAVGLYPSETVDMMDRVIEFTETAYRGIKI